MVQIASNAPGWPQARGRSKSLRLLPRNFISLTHDRNARSRI
jgi:hypothetical protein